MQQKLTLVTLLFVLALASACATTPAEPVAVQPPPADQPVPAPETVAPPPETVAPPPEVVQAPAPPAPLPPSPFLEEELKKAATNGYAADAFLQFAARNGAWQDGLSAEIALGLAAEKWGPIFVGAKCKICSNIKRGLQDYGAAHLTPGGAGLAEAEWTALQSSDQKVRHQAMAEVVHRWVERAFAALAMEGEARQKLEDELVQRRKNGMQAKPFSFERCPSCDGANNLL